MSILQQPRQRSSWCITHGGSKIGAMHPVYKVWVAMRQRCQNPKHKDYHRYGGRGIMVCDRWADFQNFIDDMGERPYAPIPQPFSNLICLLVIVIAAVAIGQRAGLV